MGRLREALSAGPGSAEAGITVVEVVIAGMILIVGGLGVFGMVDAATRNTFRAEQSQAVSNVLQREMERIREMPYEEVGLSAQPSEEAGANNPNSRVVSDGFYTGRSGTNLRALVLDGSLSPEPEEFQVDDVKGKIYRYVVWDACGVTGCDDYLKRVIVAVKLDATAPGGAARRYQEIPSQIVDPEVEPVENPGPTPGGSPVTSWPLWLTDTTCEASIPEPPAEREDHETHNTRGACSDGIKTGNAPGAPDLLWNAAPDLSGESPVWDYSTDVEPVAEPDRDKGLQVKRGGSCETMPAAEVRTQPDADTSLFQKLHKWVSPPIDTTDLALTGEATLNIRTQSIEHGVYPAKICIWIFVREEESDTVLPQTLEALPYATYGASTWPSTSWQEIIVPLDFGSPEGGEGEIPLPQGSRVGLALSVDESSGSGIQVLYDEPSFDSRVSLETTGTLPEWP